MCAKAPTPKMPAIVISVMPAMINMRALTAGAVPGAVVMGLRAPGSRAATVSWDAGAATKGLSVPTTGTGEGSGLSLAGGSEGGGANFVGI